MKAGGIQKCDRFASRLAPGKAIQAEIPLASNATCTIGEIVAAFERVSEQGIPVMPRGCVLRDEAAKTDLLFVKHETSDRDYSPSTRYAGHLVSPTLFHRESQNSATPDTAAGHRIVEQSSW